MLPRREPTRVLVGEDKPEYIPKKGIIVADCEIIKRQLLRSRGDIIVKLASEMEELPDDQFERVQWLENLRVEEKIDGFITTRSLHSSLSSKPRRHTLGMQRQDDSRARFIPVPLEGYTVLPHARISQLQDFQKLSILVQHYHLDSN